MINYVDEYGNIWDLAIRIDQYQNNGNLYVGLVVGQDAIDDDGEIDAYRGEPYADLSVNIIPLPDNLIAVDTNNFPDAENFITENNLGDYIGQDIESGFCTYPIYKIDKLELEKHMKF